MVRCKKYKQQNTITFQVYDILFIETGIPTYKNSIKIICKLYFYFIYACLVNSILFICTLVIVVIKYMITKKKILKLSFLNSKLRKGTKKG